ncbi:TetR/AcrR family transcriptional regulator [Bacillus sp. FJAT-47783]|uniref:TetR/AcrR family transcriptional regulator n=1 Tax=Bacillus sp. FJAT-47783 TaxID=2922712 RepID=UPI001FADFB51|nr:TetR/AcrR family transcriptional regulator [Bacillus sp. FJAT-47783]
MKDKRPKYKKIIDAAVVIIAENGYHAAQVSKIAKQAGVADGTIYLYFKNKEDILISLFKEKMGLHVEKILHKLEGKQTASEKLYTLVENHFAQFVQDPHYAIVTQLELRQTNRELRQKINQVLKSYLNVIDDIIEHGRMTNEFRQDLDLRIARQMIFGVVDEIATTWVMNDQKYNLLDLVPPVYELLMNGFGKRN